MFDFPLSEFTDIKKQRNTRKSSDPNVTLLKPYSMPSSSNQHHLVTIKGNPNLGEISTMMIGVRNKASAANRSAEVWLNELRLTDFNEEGGIGAIGNLVVNLSDFANINLSGRYETVGFGGVEQNINQRRLDNYYQINMSTSVQLGKLFPEKTRVNLPVYYSYSVENSSPKYSPLEGDLLLKDALSTYSKQEEKDSVLRLSETKTVTESFNLTGVRVDIRSKRPQMYDPANISVNYAYQKSSTLNPEVERNANISHQGSINYDFNTQPQTWEPFKNSKALQKPIWALIRDFGINYSPSRLGLSLNVSRMYNETQMRDLQGSMMINKYDP